jgi:ribosomal protein L11 methyltransferase
LIRLAVRCGPEAAELVLAELLGLAPGGVEEEHGPGWVEYAIYGAQGELPDLGSVEALAGAEPITVSSEEVPDDWADRWRDFHQPIWIADGRVVVRPSWAEAHPVSHPDTPGRGSSMEMPEAKAEGKVFRAGAEEVSGIDVVVDPGQAFGTGAHPTTRMCIELLVEMAEAEEAVGPLVDLGTGSGVLAIAAAKLGFDPVLAVDHEPAALDAARANAAANGVELGVERVNLREQEAPFGETVVANLTAPLLLELAARLKARPDWIPRRLVCSGLLAREVEAVSEAFSEAGLEERRRRASGDWCAIAFAAP